MSEVQPWGLVMKQVLLGTSAFAVGVLLYRTFVFERHRNRPLLAIGFLGVAIVLVLIGEIVMRSVFIPVTWRAGLYALGLICITVGFLGDAMRSRRGRR